MDYLDMIRDLAAGEDPIDPTDARAVLNGAERELSSLREQVAARFPEDTDAPENSGQKPRSSFSMSEKAAFYEEQRQAGNDPAEAWQKLPE